MKGLSTLTWMLLIVGGVNWLLVGLIKWDVGMIFGGQMAAVSRVIYVLIGLSAIVQLFAPKRSGSM